MGKKTNGVHWSFWVIGILSLFWNVMGSINFVMQLNPEMLAGYSEAARILVEGRPVWATSAFALAVFGGVLGSLLLLFKKAIAYPVFVASFLGVVVTGIHTFEVTDSTEIWIGSLLSLIVAMFLVVYSKRVERKGWTG